MRSQKKKLKKEKGITLVALVITIIVLLILAGVSIAALGGQNGILSNATEAKKQSEIGDIKDEARLDINSKQTEKLSPDITDEELEGILGKYGTLTGEGDILDKTLVTKNGYEIPVKEIWNGTIDDGNTEEPKEPVDLEVGDYVRYNVTYTDMYTDYEFTAEDGWRVLEPGTENGDGTYEGLKLISTGIPAKLYYDYTDIKNIEYDGSLGNWGGNEEQRAQYAIEYYQSPGKNNYNMYAAAGMRYNFGKIRFINGTSSENKNEGYYKEVNGKIDGNLEEGEFLKEGATEVHNLTLAELNKARGESDLKNRNSVNTNSGAKGLFYLKGLEEYGYNSDSTPDYWLASPNPTATASLWNVYSYGDIEYGNCRDSGVRPVVSLPSNVQIEKIELK